NPMLVNSAIETEWLPAPEDLDVDLDEVNNIISKLQSDIKAQAGRIDLTASKKELDELSGNVREQSARLTVAYDSISQLVEDSIIIGEDITNLKSFQEQTAERFSTFVVKDDMNEYTGRVSNVESEITQLADEIYMKVGDLQYIDDDNNIVQRLNYQLSQIEMLESEISLRVTKTDLDMVTNRVDEVESDITILSDNIALNVSNFNNLKSTVDTELLEWKNSSFIVDVEGISSRVSDTQWKSDYSGQVDDRIGSLGSENLIPYSHI